MAGAVSTCVVADARVNLASQCACCAFVACIQSCVAQVLAQCVSHHNRIAEPWGGRCVGWLLTLCSQCMRCVFVERPIMCGACSICGSQQKCVCRIMQKQLDVRAERWSGRGMRTTVHKEQVQMQMLAHHRGSHDEEANNVEHQSWSWTRRKESSYSAPDGDETPCPRGHVYIQGISGTGTAVPVPGTLELVGAGP